MAAIVSLRDVIDEMEIMSDEATAYINRKTGELITIADEMFSLAEDPDEAEDAPEWQKEFMPKVREVTASEDFIPLPSKFDIHEWSIMETLCPVGCRRRGNSVLWTSPEEASELGPPELRSVVTGASENSNSEIDY